jgi:hypothetical protein
MGYGTQASLYDISELSKRMFYLRYQLMSDRIVSIRAGFDLAH